MRLILLISIVVLTACSSSPTRRPAAEKVTQVSGGETSKVEVFTVVEYSPRRVEELELGVLNAFKTCLQGRKETPVVVGFTGNMNYQGQVLDGQLETGDQALKDCLGAAISGIRIGRGKTGPFKMSLATGPNLIKGAKSRVISLPETKKFE